MKKQNSNLDLKGKRRGRELGMCVCEMFQAKGTAYIKAYR